MKVIQGLLSLLVGAAAGALFLLILAPAIGARSSVLAPYSVAAGQYPVQVPGALPRPGRATPPPPIAIPQAPVPPGVEHLDWIKELRAKNLTLPVWGIDRSALRESFYEGRSGSRRHEAIDILAPRNTPVLAVEDGKIAKLFFGRLGGNTIYQFDPTGTYIYYYAHLQRYADNLKQGDSIKRGQVIGYVGTSGDAPPNTPHLHFAIYRANQQKQWWQGVAVDPYPVLR